MQGNDNRTVPHTLAVWGLVLAQLIFTSLRVLVACDFFLSLTFSPELFLSALIYIFYLACQVETNCSLFKNLFVSYFVFIMSSNSFGAFIDFESTSKNGAGPSIPSAPQKAVPRVYHSVPHTPEIELESIQWGKRPKVPSESGTSTPTGYQTPRVPNDIEMSRPASPTPEGDGVDAIQSFSNPPMNRFRMTSVCLLNFANGLSDSAPGALIPYLEK